MDDLTTRVAKLLWAKLPHPQACPDQIDEAARAAVKLVLDEAANEASAYMDKTGFFDADSQAQLIGRTIRALGVQP